MTALSSTGRGFTRPWLLDVCGAHSTGKTTVINGFVEFMKSKYPRTDIHIIPSHSRNYLSAGSGPGFSRTTISGQFEISCVNWVNVLHSTSAHRFTICTDFGVRSYAYAKLGLGGRDPVLLDCHVKFLQWAYSWLVRSIINPEFFYIPIEFPIVPDGVRDADPEFQRDVDTAILDAYNLVGIKPVQLTGSVGWRVQTMVDHLFSHNLERYVE